MVALLFMLGFLAGLGLRIYAGDQTTRFLGPDHLVASEEQVYIHANGHLFVLDSTGKTLRHFNLIDTLLIGGVIDLRLMPDGQLLIAEQMPARIHLCDAEQFKCSELGVPLSETLARQYKVLPDASGEYLYITDSTRGGALYQVDIAAGSLKPILMDTLSFANDIQYGPEGQLMIADSFHRRVVEVRVADNGAELAQVLFNTDNEAVRGDHNWPMMLHSLMVAIGLYLNQPPPAVRQIS